MNNIYKEIAISLLSLLSKDDSGNTMVIGVSSSNASANTAFLARELLDFYESNDYNTILINAVVDGNELIIPSEISDGELSFSAAKDKITYSAGKELVEGLKAHYQIVIIALDKLTNSVPSMIFGSCCNGIVLLESKDVSDTLQIDEVLNCIRNIGVKPLGFVLG